MAEPIRIVYCKPCGYARQATEAQVALRASLGREAELVAGKGGVFEVFVGARSVARRSRTGFPSSAAIVQAVAAALKGSPESDRGALS